MRKRHIGKEQRRLLTAKATAGQGKEIVEGLGIKLRNWLDEIIYLTNRQQPRHTHQKVCRSTHYNYIY
jgi:hypothetical protein